MFNFFYWIFFLNTNRMMLRENYAAFQGKISMIYVISRVFLRSCVYKKFVKNNFHKKKIKKILSIEEWNKFLIKVQFLFQWL